MLDKLLGLDSAREAGTLETGFEDTRRIADAFTSAGLPIDPRLKNTQDYWTNELSKFNQIGLEMPNDEQLKQMTRAAGGIDQVRTDMVNYFNDAKKVLTGMTAVATAAENYQVGIMEQGVAMQKSRFQQANRMVTMANGMNREYYLMSGNLAASGYNAERFKAIGRRAGNIL